MPKPRISISSSRLTNSPQAGDLEPGLPLQEEAATYTAPAAQHTKRTEFIPLSRVMPDPYQARVILPAEIASQFFSGQMDCYAAGRAWLELAAGDAPVAQRIHQLVSLGGSLTSDGQIKNATGSWQRQGDGPALFVLETGERRFWGLVLWALQNDLPDEPTLEAVSIPEPNRVRQVIENEKNEPPTAVARARAIAGLINYYYELAPENGAYSRYDYHRKALGQRVSLKIWGELERVFSTSRNHLSEHLQILTLPDHLLDLADEYAVPERKLREIRKFPEDQWEGLLRLALQQGLSSDELRQNQPRGARRSTDVATKSARQMKGILLRLSRGKGQALGALADSLYAEFDTPDQALTAAERLEDLAEQIRVRVAGQEY